MLQGCKVARPRCKLTRLQNWNDVKRQFLANNDSITAKSQKCLNRPTPFGSKASLPLFSFQVRRTLSLSYLSSLNRREILTKMVSTSSNGIGLKKGHEGAEEEMEKNLEKLVTSNRQGIWRLKRLFQGRRPSTKGH